MIVILQLRQTTKYLNDTVVLLFRRKCHCTAVVVFVRTYNSTDAGV